MSDAKFVQIVPMDDNGNFYALDAEGVIWKYFNPIDSKSGWKKCVMTRLEP